jgi:hypothetical protein
MRWLNLAAEDHVLEGRRRAAAEMVVRIEAMLKTALQLLVTKGGGCRAARRCPYQAAL